MTSHNYLKVNFVCVAKNTHKLDVHSYTYRNTYTYTHTYMHMYNTYNTYTYIPVHTYMHTYDTFIQTFLKQCILDYLQNDNYTYIATHHLQS